MHICLNRLPIFSLLAGTFPNALRQTTVQVIPQATCNQFWGQTSAIPPVIFEAILNQHVCAAAAGKDTCTVSQMVCKKDIRPRAIYSPIYRPIVDEHST
jgi:hypothetical protein